MTWLISIVAIVWTSLAWAKGSQAIYQDPFDLAAGGSSLTRATQDAVIYANPALMPFGQKFFRWAGIQSNILAGVDSIDEAQSMAKGGGSPEASNTDFVDKVLGTPLHVGLQNTLSVITSKLGFGLLTSAELDLRGQKHDATGLPSIRARAVGIGGGALGLAHNPFPWLGLGITSKYLYKTEPDVTVALSDQEQIEELRSDPQALQDEFTPGRGAGFDAGLLLFKQGPLVDWRLAAKVDDIGDTSFGGAQDPYLQMMHLGVGMTLHNAVDALHLSADLRDLSQASGETMVMRTHIGAKILIRKMFGIAVGLYQGYPTYGLRFDFWIIKGGFTYYQKEMGEYAGDDGRKIYTLYTSLGF